MDHNVHRPIPASTLIVMRETSGLPQYLLVRRAMTMAFAPGAYVFPGGRIDDDDHYLGRIYGALLDPMDAAARVAAIRETLEETGLAIGINLAAGDAASVRRALLSGDVFSEALQQIGGALALQTLQAYSHWCPAHKVERIFDTRFYLTYVGRGCPGIDDIVADAAENTHALWIEAQALLNMADSGEARVIFPTRANLARLAQYDDHAAASADLVRHPARLVEPVIGEQGKDRVLSIPEGIGYPLTVIRVG